MLSSPSRRPGKRPAPPGPEGSDGDGDGEADWISGLPDDLLHLVLLRLECAREAARTSILSRRWRGLWTRLREYTFSDMEPEVVETAFAQITRSALDHLDIQVVLERESALDRATSLLLAAARLLPETASISLYNPDNGKGISLYDLHFEEAAVDLPCFGRTTSLSLDIYDVRIAPPPAGEFSRLESLELATGSNIFPGLLPSCPHLRVLRIYANPGLSEVTVHSATLEELNVVCQRWMSTSKSWHAICQIDIDTPELKRMKFNVEMDIESSVTFSAPKVEELDAEFVNRGRNVGLPIWGLLNLNNSLSQGVGILRLNIDCVFEDEDPDWSFVEETARLTVSDFSDLELSVETGGHTFGPLLWHLLQVRPAIQRLKVVLGQAKNKAFCTHNCTCRQPVNWENENISLTDLEEVLISYGLEGGDEEVDFLKLLFRCAPGLKSMRVGVRDEAYKMIRSICEENPHVKCEVSHC